MPKYMLVSFKTCPWVQRSAIVLREKGTPFELRHIEPDNRPDWFLAISPHKKVPAMTVDDTISLFEFERDQRVPRRDDRTAAAPGRPGRARPKPRLDRLRPDLFLVGDRVRLCRNRGGVQGGGGENPRGVRPAGKGA